MGYQVLINRKKMGYQVLINRKKMGYQVLINRREHESTKRSNEDLGLVK